MVRNTSNELRLKCNYCKEFTQSLGRIIFKKERGNRFHIRATCVICNKQKSKYLNKAQVDILPPELKDAEDNKTFVDNIETKTGGIIPILPVIAAIAAGITALSTAGGVAANTIISAKNSAETERHNKELEHIARGNGLNNTEVNNANDLMLLLQTINNNIKELSNEQKRTLQNPIGTMSDEEAKKSHGHRTPGLSPISSMSDDELTQRSVAYLTGKGFQIQYL